MDTVLSDTEYSEQSLAYNKCLSVRLKVVVRIRMPGTGAGSVVDA